MSIRASKSFEEWRSHFLVRLIWLISALGVIEFLSSISAILDRGLYSVLITDIGGLAILSFASFKKSWSLRLRSLLTSLVIYVVGLSLVFNYGFMSAGHFFLFMVPIFATIFFTTKIGFLFLGVNVITWLSIYILSLTGGSLMPELNGMTSKGILTIFINIFGVNLLVMLPIGRLLKKLKASLEETQQVKNQLAEQNLKLQAVNDELDEFLYRSAHDLRSPLTSLLGLIDITKYESDHRLNDNFKMMNEKVDDLDSRLLDILNYSRNLNTQPLIEVVNLQSVINSILKNYNFIDHKIQFRIDIPQGFQIKTDKRRLSTILENLIGNAIKYADHEKDSVVAISSKHEGSEHRIIIKDNGLGIKKEFLEKVFERFFRAHEESTGSGLGLYIALKTADKINGRIDVSSKEGEGSTFTLILNEML